jgi:hypothetical protein
MRIKADQLLAASCDISIAAAGRTGGSQGYRRRAAGRELMPHRTCDVQTTRNAQYRTGP